MPFKKFCIVKSHESKDITLNALRLLDKLKPYNNDTKYTAVKQRKQFYCMKVVTAHCVYAP